MKIKYITKILTIIKKLSDWKHIEYIYLDEEILYDFHYYLTEFKNKIIVTKTHDNQYKMLTVNNDNTYTSTIINKVPIIDLILINQEDNNLKKYTDSHTIYLKKLNNHMIYITDNLKKTQIINTEYEEIILQGTGLNTKLLDYQIHP
ncbi:hypothetical protein [Methanosphaera sp. WGK6]|uniref:hypothetical protein n=1 Tax=Methanosphaera sp. WGK6 TaxID=1561964 RepID=UPI00084C65A9|nr:hypothetical protein [Methanosphaera sp. WGK6]OED29722.1 hypothetical protein NL43_06525 [Methanosphaera sp. WGK6]